MAKRSEWALPKRQNSKVQKMYEKMLATTEQISKLKPKWDTINHSQIWEILKSNSTKYW